MVFIEKQPTTRLKIYRKQVYYQEQKLFIFVRQKFVYKVPPYITENSEDYAYLLGEILILQSGFLYKNCPFLKMGCNKY